MKNKFDDILDICLDRVMVRGDTIEQCLESYPEQAAELEPLLRAALSAAGASSRIEPSPEFQRLAKHRLLSVIEEKRKKRVEHRMPLWGWQRRWAIAIMVVLVIILAGVGTVTASASSLPGDTFYPVKTATEKVQGFFTFGSEAKANLYMKLAQRRLDELKSLVERNRDIPQSLLGLMNTETDGAIELLSQNRQVGNESIARLMGLTANQKTVLAELIDRVPVKAKLKIQEALKRSEYAQGRALLLKDKIHRMGKPQVSPSLP
jgi:Domain of unknown function (DUF5667)